MNRLKKRIHSFCNKRAQSIMTAATEKAKDVSHKTMSDASRRLIRSVAEQSINDGQPAPDAYKKIVEQVFGNHVSRISTDMRVPMIVAAIVMNKKEWIYFHSSHINDFLNYYNTATYSVSKAYVASFIEIAKQKRQKTDKVEKSAINSPFEDLDYDN